METFERLMKTAAWLDEPVDESTVLPPPSNGVRYAPLGSRAFPINWYNILTSKVHNQIQCLLVPRESLNRVGPFKQNSLLFAEYNLTIRLFVDNFDSVHYLPDVLFRYRQVKKSQTRNVANFQRYVAFLPVLMNWSFSFPAIQEAANSQRSAITATMYGHFLRSRVDIRDMESLQFCLKAAWNDPNVKPLEWAKLCLPFWFRAALPPEAETFSSCASLFW